MILTFAEFSETQEKTNCKGGPTLDREVSESRSVVFDSLQPRGLYSPWNSPGQNTGVGSLSLLQWIFPTQESNWGLLHCRQVLYQLSCQGRSEAFLQIQAEKRVKSQGSF